MLLSHCMQAQGFSKLNHPDLACSISSVGGLLKNYLRSLWLGRTLPELHKNEIQCVIFIFWGLFLFLFPASVSCSDPGTPHNGRRRLTSFAVGSRVSYSCLSAYSLRGNISRICQANGLWSGDLPSCEGIRRNDRLLLCKQNHIADAFGTTAA